MLLSGFHCVFYSHITTSSSTRSFIINLVLLVFRMKVASLTEYVRKAIAKGKPKLPPKVPSNNPPLVVEEVM